MTKITADLERLRLELNADMNAFSDWGFYSSICFTC